MYRSQEKDIPKKEEMLNHSIKEQNIETKIEEPVVPDWLK
jgi:hypothetical protein